MTDKVEDIVIEDVKEEVDYDIKQFIDIRYKMNNGKLTRLHAYNTSASTIAEAIYLEHFDILNDVEIEEVQILIVGTYEHLTILGHKNISYKITVNCNFSKQRQTEISYLSITAGNQVRLNQGKIEFMDCIGMSKLLIESSEIELLTMDRVENVEVNDSQISKFIISHMKKLKDLWGKTTDKIIINYSSFNHFMLYDEVNKLKFNECDVRRYSQREIVCEYSEVYSTILPAYTLPTNKFKSINRDCCKLGLRAARVSDDLELYIEYNDILMDLERKKCPRWKRLSYYYLNRTIGYGFKPVRALWFSLGAIAIFALIYLCIDLLFGKLVFYKITGWSDIGDSIMIMIKYLYQSGITYTTIGFSDILQVTPLFGLIYVLEALMGISVLSLFVFALTRKYFFGK